MCDQTNLLKFLHQKKHVVIARNTETLLVSGEALMHPTASLSIKQEMASESTGV